MTFVGFGRIQPRVSVIFIWSYELASTDILYLYYFKKVYVLYILTNIGLLCFSFFVKKSVVFLVFFIFSFWVEKGQNEVKKMKKRLLQNAVGQ